MDLKKVKTVYFLGIGGIGMSALARYFNSLGARVYGYDLTQTQLTSDLEKEDIIVYYTDDPGHIPSDTDLVIYTPAIPYNHLEFQYVKQKRIPLMKRSEVLGAISKGQLCIAVAGTHGKTSTSSMIAWLLESAGIESIAFMGGIAKNFNSNLHLGNNPAFMVVEADEFDRSFHQLSPKIAVVTSADADHLDIYGTYDELLDAFREFCNKTRENGTIIIKKNLSFSPQKKENIKVLTYSITEDADYSASNIKYKEGYITFSLKTPSGIIKNLILNIPGIVNVENAVAAIAASLESGVNPELIHTGLQTYSGVQRRFDIRFQTSQMIFMDDYAHHPEEIRACIESTRLMWPGKHIAGIFQPHLFSRTNDFAEEFAESLDLLDTCMLLEIYPAREKPIAGVSSEMILNKMKNTNSQVISKNQVFTVVMDIPEGVLLTIGAGDIDQLVKPICKTLTRRFLINS